VTLPALMQEVQTFRRFGLPATVARTRWIFGSQRRLVFFFDQGTLWPKPGPFPQMSHTAATGVHFHSICDLRPTSGQPRNHTRALRRLTNHGEDEQQGWIGLASCGRR
jgi:hypothetical protein